MNFMLGTFEPNLQLIFDSFQILDMAGGSVKEGDFGGLLVRGGEGILETGIPFSELVASALL
jgi:hypothetical protein